MADTAFYQGMAEVALRLIQEKGQTLVWTRQGTGVYDPVEDEMGPAPSQTQTIQCVVLPASKGTIEAFDNRLVSGTLIDQNLRFMKVAAAGLQFAPKAGDTTEFEGARWRALGSTPVSPAGIPLIYNVAVERG